MVMRASSVSVCVWFPQGPSRGRRGRSLAGAQAPAGFWDPLGISDGISEEQFNRYRAVEQKHGRIFMIAVNGYCVPHFIGKTNPRP